MMVSYPYAWMPLAVVVDRRAFGLTWNALLPSGRHALANEVTLEAELYLVKV